MPIHCGDIENLLQTYLDDELADDDSSAVAEHVAECPSCKKHVADEARFHSDVRYALEPPPAPESLRDNLCLVLDREDWQARKRGRSAWTWVLPGSATLAAAAALLLFVVSNQDFAADAGSDPAASSTASSGATPGATRSATPSATYDDAVRRHVRKLPIEVQGAAVQDWASQHMPRQAALPRFSTPRTDLLGARLSHLDGRDALQLYYQARVDHRVYEMTGLILDASDLDFRTRERRTISGRELWVGKSMGYNVVAHKDERGIGYVFISEMTVAQLLDTVGNSDLLVGMPEFPTRR